MKWTRIIAVCLLAYGTIWTPQSVLACPLCAEAIANSNSGQAEEEKDNFPAAMNQSIYLMLGVPYAAFGIVGMMIYYGCKKNEAYLEALRKQSEPEA